jgi:gliding motility-associated-like protein
LEFTIPVYNSEVTARICEGDIYPFGTSLLNQTGLYSDTLQTQNNCDSIVSLNLEVIGDSFDTLDISILEGETFKIEKYKFSSEGLYPLNLTSDLGCDSLVLLRLDVFNIFIPNAFSPNSDGINDVFNPFAEDDRIESYDMKIFDRWGNLYFQGQEWDGKGVQTGVFTYVVEIKFTNGDSKIFSGAITLVK